MAQYCGRSVLGAVLTAPFYITFFLLSNILSSFALIERISVDMYYRDIQSVDIAMSMIA